MALTVTTLVNAASKVAATPVRVANAAATALQAGSVGLTLFGKISSVGQQASTSPVRLYYAIVPYDSTDGIEPQVKSLAKFLELKWSGDPTQPAVTATPPEPVTAGYLHTWLEIPNLPFGATVTVTLVESPSTLVLN